MPALNLIIGCGTGRCGTYTLSKLLSVQPGVLVTHEKGRLPWEPNEQKMFKFLSRLAFATKATGGPYHTVGNVGFYWCKYVQPLVEFFGENVKIVCLQRDRQEVIDSFCAYMPAKNFWTAKNSDKFRDGTYRVSKDSRLAWPKFKAPKREALGMFWDLYKQWADHWAGLYPKNFLLADMKETMNTEFGQSRMLKFVGIPVDRQVLKVGAQLNTRQDAAGEIN